MTVYVDKLVLMHHPLFNGDHVIAKVVVQTAKTVQVIYWHRSCNEWRHETQRRNIDAVIKILSDDLDELKPDQLTAFAEKIDELRKQRDRAIKQASEIYWEKAQELTL